MSLETAKDSALHHPQSHSHQAQGENGSPAKSAHHGDMIRDIRKRFWISLIATVPILALSPIIQEFLGLQDALRFPGDQNTLLALSTFVFFYGGYPFLKGFRDELRKRRPGMMTLIALAVTTAYIYSGAVVLGLAGEVFFWELATLIDIMLLGHWIEMKSVGGASRALEEMARLLPGDAHRLRPDGTFSDVPLSELVPGDRILIKPGEKIPADGEVFEGESAVNEAMLTGESIPRPKSKGSAILGGSVNGEGSLSAEVKKTGRDSYLAQVAELVRQARESKSRTQNLADRAALGLTLVALGAGAMTLFFWLAVAGRPLAFGLERMVTVMVISCPHALGLAVPLVVAVSTALAAKNGLLIRNRAAFEKARLIQAMVFDKTGTLTEGRFGVTDVLVLKPGLDEQTLLQWAASVEIRSEHPIAKGIVASASTAMLPVSEFKAIPGRGAEGRLGNREVKVVSPGYLKEMKADASDPRIGQLLSQGKTVVFVLADGAVAGALALADRVRPESRPAIRRLKEMGVRCLMLTGDNRLTAKRVADEVGLDEYFAEVLPGQKSEKIKEVQARGMVVAMTGDGVNDAPALAQADVGLAIGAGTDVAMETADIILVKSDPRDAASLLELARTTYRKIVQNLAWAAGYNVIAIPLAAGVLDSSGILLSPAIGAVLMSASTLIVAVNSRLLRFTGMHTP